MGSCVLKECGFQLNNRQIVKEKTFKEHIRSDYFFRMAEDFDPSKQKTSKLELNHCNSEENEEISQVNTKGPSSKEKFEKLDKFDSQKFTSPTMLPKKKEENYIFKKEECNSSPVFEKKHIKSALKNKIKKEETEDLRKSGSSSDYKTGFNNKLFFNEKLSSDNENNEFEQIFKDEGDSDDEAYIEKMFPASSFKKSTITS